MDQNKKNKVKDFFRKEGFYLVLLVCLCVVATIAAFTIKKNSVAKEQNKTSNELSLNDYKKWFQSRIDENPKYDYTEDNYTMTPHICPICGKYEFKDTDSHDICAFCGWEDDELMEYDPSNWAGCANPLCLNDYRKDYQQKIKDNPDYKWKIDRK